MREREIGTGEWEHGIAYHASMEPRQEICHSGELNPRIQTPWNGSRPSWNGEQGKQDIHALHNYVRVYIVHIHIVEVHPLSCSTSYLFFISPPPPPPSSSSPPPPHLHKGLGCRTALLKVLSVRPRLPLSQPLHSQRKVLPVTSHDPLKQLQYSLRWLQGGGA